MNAKHFQRLNPNFKFSKIFLYNQSKFNNYGNMKKYFFPLNNGVSNNKVITELIEDKNLDYLTQKLISQFKTESNKIDYKNGKKLFTTPNKKNNIKEIRSIILKNNNPLQKIDFYINNISDELNDSLELNINRYFSRRKQNQKFPLTIKNNKGVINMSENTNITTKTKNKKDISTNKSYETVKTELPDIKLPNILSSLHRRSINISSSLNKIIENHKIKEKKKDNKNIIQVNKSVKDNKEKPKKSMQRDIFKNINYYIDNKKTQLNVNDIQRTKYDINNNEDEEDDNEDNEKNESKIFINTKIPNNNKNYIEKNNINDNKDNLNNELYNEEFLKMKEKEKYMIYEKNKKFIDKNKIYDTMKYGAASIPNLTLDKDFKNIKKFESKVLKMRKTQTDIPIYIRNNQIN